MTGYFTFSNLYSSEYSSRLFFTYLFNRQKKEPAQYKPNTEPFQSHTTSNDTFTGQIVPKQRSFKPENKAVASDAPFEGATTANSEYKEYPIQPRFTFNIKLYNLFFFM